MYNPTLYIIKRKLCKFKVCSTFLLCVFNSCFVDAGVMYTYERLVMYMIILTGYLYLLCFLIIKKQY